MSANSGTRFDRTEILVAAAALGFVAPSLVDLCTSQWKRRAFGWVAADTFYYLTVARNLAEHGVLAYDQHHPNNGFHPLWQALCVGLAVVARVLGLGELLVLSSVLVGLGFIVAAVVLVGRSLAAGSGRVSALFPLLPIGAYALIVLPAWARGGFGMNTQNVFEGSMPLYGTLWSFANGMESCLVLFFFALAGLIFAKRDVRSDLRAAVAFGLSLAGLVLSRLDHVLLLLPLLGALAFSVLGAPERRGPVGACLGAFAAPLAFYVAVNRYAFGAAVPVSGSLKSAFPHVLSDNIDTLVAFWTQPWRGALLTMAYRQFAVGIPVLAALAYLAAVTKVGTLHGAVVLQLRPWTTRYHAFLALVAPGVILLAGYNVLFVQWWNQGHWYFPASALYVSLAALALAPPVESRLFAWLRLRMGGRVDSRVFVAAWLVTCAVCLGVVFLNFHRRLNYHQNYADFYLMEAPQVRKHYGALAPCLVEHDDGIVAYSSGYPTMSSGMGLDPEGASALRSGHLLELALERHYDRITSLVYTPADRMSSNPTAAEVRAWASAMVAESDPQAFDFALDYRSVDGRFAIARVSKKN